MQFIPGPFPSAPAVQKGLDSRLEMSMLTSSDISTPILSRSAGCPLTDKVALVTIATCFCYVTLLNSYNWLLSLLSYSIQFVFLF